MMAQPQTSALFPDIVLTPKPSGSYETWCKACGTMGWAFDRSGADAFRKKHERCVRRGRS